MSAEFVLPDWMPRAEPAPPPSDASEVDPHRVEGLVNRFIAAKQDALFGAPDAYYRQTGAAAVDGASGILGRLEALREATLDAAGDDGLRRVLGPRLDLHIADAADGIDRHVAPQRDALSRQIIRERQTLLERAAALEHPDDEKLDGLAEANAGAALELARLTGEPDGSAADAARSAIWRTAIDRRLANGNGAQALALFERVKDRLAAADRLALDAPVQVARHDQAAEQWLARQTATDRRPLQERLDADPDLSPEARLVVRAKADARDSAEQSARLAKVQELDDRMVAAAGALATRPGAYAPGTLARIADAYDAAGAPDKAALARRTAAQEAFVLPFAQASAEKQQRLIDELPDGDLRDTAVAIQRHQADAFARDAFAAGTALYADVGPPVPIDDIEGRVRQARQIAQRRGIPVAPFTEGEIDGMRRSEEEPQQTEQTEQRTEAAPQDENGAARQSPNDPRDDEASEDRPDPNIVLVAGNGKEKRPPLLGGRNLARFGPDGELPAPKQIDPFAGGGGGRGLRSLPKRDTPARDQSATVTDKSSERSRQEKQRLQLEENKAKGRAWEMEQESMYRKKRPNVGAQITVQTPAGSRGRIDIMTRDSEGGVECIECKASQAAPVKENQQRFFEDLERLGGTVMGKGKPTFKGGLELPPTPMKIDRKEE